ncbi:hypothetical protein [Actinokineospora enzanensis]|uniref:hypothetical protein n=1 Tax=Actinokineospora enzanensis TaxID=155975 RepID=UPI00037B19EE|nr:hypothetical protein [Actinokineospora enzanensis]
MPTFERNSGGHLAASIRTHDQTEIARYRRLVEDGIEGWREVADPGKAPKGKTKGMWQADAEALGLDTSGTIPELVERINARIVELNEQAAELGVDPTGLTAVELAAAIEAKLGE